MLSSDGKFKYLSLLMALNITFLLVSDFTGARIIAIYGVGVSVTVLYFPFTYLIGDILTEVYGYAQARRVIWISILCSVAGSAVAGVQLLVPAAAFFDADAAFQTIFSPSLKISEGASQSWCSPAGESPARVRSSEPPGSKCCCVKKTRRRHAVREMKEGPSEPPCRRRLQTATSCFGQKPRW